MGSPHRQSVSEISYSLGIHVITLSKFRKTKRVQGEVMPCFQGNPEDCEPLDKFKVLQEKDGLKTMECTVATGSAACSLSRWTVGHMPPRIPMRSFYSPWPMRKSSRSAIPRVPDPSNLYFAGSENHGSAPHRTINKPFSKAHHGWKNECWQGLLRDSVQIVQCFSETGKHLCRAIRNDGMPVGAHAATY